MKSLIYGMWAVVSIFALTSCQTVGNEKEVEVEVCYGPLIKVFDNTNIRAVGNNGQSPTFNVPPSRHDQPYCLIKMYTYHWNGGQGQAAGRIGIQDGMGNQKWWQATATDSPAGNKRVDWTVNISELVILRNSAGPYKVLDSHPASWSQNNFTQGKGFAKVWVQKYVDL